MVVTEEHCCPNCQGYGVTVGRHFDATVFRICSECKGIGVLAEV